MVVIDSHTGRCVTPPAPRHHGCVFAVVPVVTSSRVFVFWFPLFSFFFLFFLFFCLSPPVDVHSLCGGQKQTKPVENNSNNKHEQREENNTAGSVAEVSEEGLQYLQCVSLGALNASHWWSQWKAWDWTQQCGVKAKLWL